MIRFRDAIDVHLSSRSALPLNPAVITVNQRSGGEVTLSIRNNAAEIRNFQVGLSADGLDFSPAQATVSVGVAIASEEMTGISELMKAADQALYDAKRAGRNRVAAMTPVMA